MSKDISQKESDKSQKQENENKKEPIFPTTGIFSALNPGIGPKTLKILNIVIVFFVLSVLILLTVTYVWGTINIHIIIFAILSVLFIVSWYWFLSNLKSSGLLEEMFQEHKEINSQKSSTEKMSTEKKEKESEDQKKDSSELNATSNEKENEPTKDTAASKKGKKMKEKKQ